MIVIIICLSIFALLLLYHILTRKYLNPYKLTFVFGKKGCGKSTLLTKLAIRYIKLGWSVYTTEAIPGTHLFTYLDIGKYKFPPHSVLLIDEASLAWDNRAFKSMKPEVIEWFRFQRHEKCKVFLFSQTFDVDLKIRNLADDMYLVTKKFRVFSYGKRVLRRTVLIEATGQSASRIDENLVFDSLLFFWCGSRTLTFIPAWCSLFDSFKASREWAVKEYEYIPLRADDIKSPRLRLSLRKWLDG